MMQLAGTRITNFDSAIFDDILAPDVAGDLRCLMRISELVE